MMDYNSYYPAQPGQPPPPPTQTMMANDCGMMGNQMMPSNGPPMMHSPAPSTPLSNHHTPGPPPQTHHQSQQMGHNIPPQQQPSPHRNYHQLPTHPPISHSASPHPASTPHGQPPPRPATGPSPLHHQSPIHMNGPAPPKIQAHGPMPSQPQSSNHMPGIPMHGPAMSGPSHSMPHQPMHHGHNFSNSPMPHHSSPHYGAPPPQPVNHHHMAHPPMNHGSHPPPPMQSNPMLGPPPPPGYLPQHPMQHLNQERGSPFYPHIPSTEFRIIELNKRIQSRPQIRGPFSSPLPYYGSSDESNWWESFVCEFFDDDSSLTLRMPGEDKTLEYKIGRTLIPRYFRSYFEGGVTDLSIKLRNIRETTHNPSLVSLDCDHADIVTKHIFKHPGTNIYRNVVVHTEGHLSLDFVSNSFDQLLIKSWRFYASQCHEYIDRTTTGHPNAHLGEPVTRFGLPKTTHAYLRMCMVMEPMQDLMAHHIQTKMDPKSCLKHILYDRYKVKNVEPPPNKRRKRKAPGTGPANPRGSPFPKKAKANSNVMNGANALSNNIGMQNNLMPSDLCGGLPLASQDVLVVGEPSMLGADFGDENERRITRLENNQYDSSVDSNPPSSMSNNGSQMNHHPILINNSAPNQHPNQQPQLQQNDPNQINPTSNHDISGNNVQNMLSYQTSNSDHLTDATSDHTNGNNGANNGIDESSLMMANPGNNGVPPPSNDNSIQNDVNHQMNYSMNGETNHVIKSEMVSPAGDPQMKQQQLQPRTPTQVAAESDTNRE